MAASDGRSRAGCDSSGVLRKTGFAPCGAGFQPARSRLFVNGYGGFMGAGRSQGLKGRVTT